MFLVWGPLHTPPCPAVFRLVRMADPKYADLPGIATDQPDTYETFSDRGQDTVMEFLSFSFLYFFPLYLFADVKFLSCPCRLSTVIIFLQVGYFIVCLLQSRGGKFYFCDFILKSNVNDSGLPLPSFHFRSHCTMYSDQILYHFFYPHAVHKAWLLLLSFCAVDRI